MKYPLLMFLLLSLVLVPCSAQDISDPEPEFEDLPLELMQRLWIEKNEVRGPFGIGKITRRLKWASVSDDSNRCRIWTLEQIASSTFSNLNLIQSQFYYIDNETNKLRCFVNDVVKHTTSLDSGYTRISDNTIYITDFAVDDKFTDLKERLGAYIRFEDRINESEWTSAVLSGVDDKGNFTHKIRESKYLAVESREDILDICSISNKSKIMLRYWSYSTGLDLRFYMDDGWLVCTIGSYKRPLFNIIARLSSDQTASVLALLDELNYKDWEPHYTNPDAIGGAVYWTRISREDVIVESKGRNAGPEIPDTLRDSLHTSPTYPAPVLLADHLLGLFFDAEKIAIDHDLSIELPEIDSFDVDR